MKTWEVLLTWETDDLCISDMVLREAPSAGMAAIAARGLIALNAKVATMQVRILRVRRLRAAEHLRVRRLRAAEHLRLRRTGLPRAWATPKSNLRDYLGDNQQQEERA